MEFFGTRRLYSYHYQWLIFLLAISASLYTNTSHFSFIYKQDISAILGLVSMAAGIYCLYLFLPGARPKLQLIRNASNTKSNRIILLNGVIFQSLQTLLPQTITNNPPPHIRKSFFWIFTLCSDIEISVNDGSILCLKAPSSILETRLLTQKISVVMNEPLIISSGNHNHRHDENIH